MIFVKIALKAERSGHDNFDIKPNALNYHKQIMIINKTEVFTGHDGAIYTLERGDHYDFSFPEAAMAFFRDGKNTMLSNRKATPK